MRRRDFLHSLISSLALSHATFARNQSQSTTKLAQTFEATRQKYNLPSLAGAIAEKISGKSWEELMQKIIFDPFCTNMGGESAMKATNEITVQMVKSHFPNG